jgi:hypothetical protein
VEEVEPASSVDHKLSEADAKELLVELIQNSSDTTEAAMFRLCNSLDSIVEQGKYTKLSPVN